MAEKQPLKPRGDLPCGLYIIATPIGNIRDMTLRAIDILGKVAAIACEDTRETGKLTAAYGISTRKIPYHEHNAAAQRPKILEMIKNGDAVALVSDAGMPLVSDPGYKLVEACLAEDLYVTCLPGATAVTTALALSGLPCDRFMFAGFLPSRTAARKTALEEIKEVPATLVFYESAPRLADSLADMGAVLGDRPATVLRELTKLYEERRHGTLSALAVHYQEAGAPRGELVVVVGAPAAAQSLWTQAQVDALLVQAMTQEGKTLRDAVAEVVVASGWKKKMVYQRALDVEKNNV